MVKQDMSTINKGLRMGCAKGVIPDLFRNIGFPAKSLKNGTFLTMVFTLLLWGFVFSIRHI